MNCYLIKSVKMKTKVIKTWGTWRKDLIKMFSIMELKMSHLFQQ